VVTSFYLFPVKHLREVTPFIRKASLLNDIGWDVQRPFLGVGVGREAATAAAARRPARRAAAAVPPEAPADADADVTGGRRKRRRACRRDPLARRTPRLPAARRRRPPSRSVVRSALFHSLIQKKRTVLPSCL